jgi:hypothetical protein
MSRTKNALTVRMVEFLRSESPLRSPELTKLLLEMAKTIERQSRQIESLRAADPKGIQSSKKIFHEDWQSK